MLYKIEIEPVPEYWGGSAFEVYADDEMEQGCDTLAEAYLYAAKRFHELGMIELQERINKL